MRSDPEVPAEPPSEEIYEALQAHGALTTADVATQAECSEQVARERLLAMSQSGLIERREVTDGYVWLAWDQHQFEDQDSS